MAQPKTKKPTGLSVVRNNGVFTLSWKRADVDYGDGQSFGYKVGTKKKWPKKYTYGQIGTTTTAKSIVLDPSDYYPFTKKGINLIRWAVRGNRKSRAIKRSIRLHLIGCIRTLLLSVLTSQLAAYRSATITITRARSAGMS